MNKSDKIKIYSEGFNIKRCNNGPYLVNKLVRKVFDDHIIYHSKNNEYDIFKWITFDGEVIFGKRGDFHREGKPAWIFPSGRIEWWRDNVWIKTIGA